MCALHSLSISLSLDWRGEMALGQRSLATADQSPESFGTGRRAVEGRRRGQGGAGGTRGQGDGRWEAGIIGR